MRTLLMSMALSLQFENIGDLAPDGSTDRRTFDVGAVLLCVPDGNHGDVCALVRRRRKACYAIAGGAAMDLNRDIFERPLPAGWKKPLPERLSRPTYWPAILALSMTLALLGP